MPESPLHGIWHGTIGGYAGKVGPRLQVRVSPKTGCHWLTAVSRQAPRYQTAGCRIDYRDRNLTLEFPRRWSLSLKLESDSLVGVFIDGPDGGGNRYPVSMTRGPWTD